MKQYIVHFPLCKIKVSAKNKRRAAEIAKMRIEEMVDEICSVKEIKEDAKD